MIEQRHYHNHKVNVQEHRAPTDKSVELLREMEQKTKDEIINSVVVKDNGFNAVIHSQKDFMSNMMLYKIIYTLNGEKRVADFSAYDDVSYETVIQQMMNKVAENISREILTKVFTADTMLEFKRNHRGY